MSTPTRAIDPEVVQRYQPLLIKRAKRFVGDELPFEEAYAYGALGLCKAARHYDPERNFASLAIRAIDASIIDGLRQILGKNMVKRHSVSLDSIMELESSSVSPMANEDTAGEVLAVFLRREVSQAVEGLRTLHWLVVRLHYWHGKTMAQIARALELKSADVAKLHQEALAELRPAFKEAMEA